MVDVAAGPTVQESGVTVDQPATTHTRTLPRNESSARMTPLAAASHLLSTPIPRRIATPLLVLTWTVATLGALVARTYLPVRFYLDGHFIQSIAVGRPFTEPDEAFAMTGEMYRLLGLTADPLLPALFGMVVAGALAAAAYSSRTTTVPLSAALLTAASLLLFAVFFSWYTKETFAALAITGSVLLIRSHAHRVWAAAPVVAYGAFFRGYWLLVVVVYIGLLVMERFRPLRWWRLLLWVAGALTVATLGYALLTGSPIQSIRASVNDVRDATDAASMISPLAPPGSFVTDVASALALFVALFVPLPLLMTGQAIHAVYAVAIVGLWLLPLLSAHSLRAAADKAGDEHARRVALSAFYLLVAFVTVLALFEPDYGSYLRHLSSMVPLMTVMAVAHQQARSTSA